MNFKEVIFSKSHIVHPLHHQLSDGKMPPISNNKRVQIIALSVLFGIFTAGVGGVVLFYALSAKHKVDFRQKSLANQKTKFTDLPRDTIGEILSHLPSSDWGNVAALSKLCRSCKFPI